MTSNILDLGILLRGLVVPLGRSAQLLAVTLTAVSLVCWLLYFRKLDKSDISRASARTKMKLDIGKAVYVLTGVGVSVAVIAGLVYAILSGSN